MNFILLKKLLRELWQRKSSLGALILIGSIGIAFLVSMVGCYQDLNNSKEYFYRDYRLADFSLQLKRAPNRLVEEALQVTNVKAVEGRIRMTGRVEVRGYPEPVAATVISVSNPRQPAFNDLLMKSGTWFSGDGSREVILNDAFAEAHDLRPGDEIRLILLGQAQTFRVVGRAQSPEFVYLLPADGGLTPDAARSGVLFMPREILEEAADLEGAFNELVGKLHDRSPAATNATLTQLEQLLDGYGVTTSTPQWDLPSVQFLQSDIDGLKVSATVMPSICLGVVVLVLNIVIGRLVAQQRTVIGTLKALGYTSASVVWHFTGFGIAVGVGSAIGGVCLGLWLQSGMLNLYRQFYHLPIVRPGFYPEIIGLSVALSLTFAVLGTAFGVRSAAKLEPADAMRPPPPEVGGSIFLEKLPWLWQRLPFRSKLVLRTIFRNPYRTLVTGGAAMVATALMVESLSMLGSVDFVIDHEFVRVAHQDVTIGLRDPAGREVLRELELLPGVRVAEPQLNLPCEISNGSNKRLTSVTGLLTSSGLREVVDVDGQPVPLPDKGLVLSLKLAQLLKVEEGQTVKLKALLAERREIEVPVVALVQTYMGLGAYARLDYLSRLLGEDWVTNSVLLRAAESEKEALTRELRRRPLVLSSDWREASLKKMRETLDQSMGVMLTIIVLFSGGLAFGSVLNTTLVSLSERQREVGTLRVLGYTPFQISKIFAGESLLVNCAGIVLGWGLGIQLVYWIVSAYDTEVFRFPPVIPSWALLNSTLVMLFFLGLAQAMIYRFLKNIPWLDVLKIRE